MRYNPATDRARSIDAIAAECRAAIVAAPQPRLQPVAATAPDYGQMLRQYGADLRSDLKRNRSWGNFLEIMNGCKVAIAMGNWAEYRRLRATLIAGLY